MKFYGQVRRIQAFEVRSGWISASPWEGDKVVSIFQNVSGRVQALR